MFPYLLMGKPTQERRTLWLLSFPLFFSVFLFSYSFYFVSLSACDAWWTALLLSSPYNFKCSIKKLSNETIEHSKSFNRLEKRIRNDF